MSLYQKKTDIKTFFVFYALKYRYESCYLMKGVKMLNIQKEEQYNKIVEKYSDMIFRIAYQYLYNKYDAEDITQDVFLNYSTKKASLRMKSILNPG